MVKSKTWGTFSGQSIYVLYGVGNLLSWIRTLWRELPHLLQEYRYKYSYE